MHLLSLDLLAHSQSLEHSGSVISARSHLLLLILSSQNPGLSFDFSIITPQAPLQSYPSQSLEGGLSKRQPRPQLLSLQTLCLDFNVQQYYLGGSLKTDR